MTIDYSIDTETLNRTPPKLMSGEIDEDHKLSVQRSRLDIKTELEICTYRHLQ